MCFGARVWRAADAAANSLVYTAAVLCNSVAALGAVLAAGNAFTLPASVVVGVASVTGGALLVAQRGVPRPWAVRVVAALTTYALPWGVIVLSGSLARLLRPQAAIGFPDESEPNLRGAIILTVVSLSAWVVISAAASREFWTLARAASRHHGPAHVERTGP